MQNVTKPQIILDYVHFLNIFLTFISLFSFIVYLVRFNTNNKYHFLTYVNTCAHFTVTLKRMVL